MYRRLSPILLVLLAQTIAGAAVADDRLGHDEARRAVDAGEIRPLGEILEAVKPVTKGTVVGVELKREHGRLVYEIKTVDGRGRRLETHVDAATGRVADTEEDD